MRCACYTPLVPPAQHSRHCNTEASHRATETNDTTELLQGSQHQAGEKWSESLSVMADSSYGPLVHGILQARILEWVDFPFSRGSSQPRDRTWTAGGFFTSWATKEAQHQAWAGRGKSEQAILYTLPTLPQMWVPGIQKKCSLKKERQSKLREKHIQKYKGMV